MPRKARASVASSPTDPSAKVIQLLKRKRQRIAHGSANHHQAQQDHGEIASQKIGGCAQQVQPEVNILRHHADLEHADAGNNQQGQRDPIDEPRREKPAHQYGAEDDQTIPAARRRHS